MNLASWPAHLRPRERGMKEGFSTLSDAELLAILLRTGRRGKNAVELAHEILSQYEGKLDSLHQTDVVSLQQKGLGNVQALTLKAALELGARLQRTQSNPQTLEEAQALVTNTIRLSAEEHFYLIPLDLRNRVIGNVIHVSKGTRYAVLVEPRDVIRLAVQRNAARIVLMHNHPSQETQPSAQDVLLTKQILEGCAWLDIEIVDHIIVTRQESTSMRRGGWF